jgi:hypothetical protein
VLICTIWELSKIYLVRAINNLNAGHLSGQLFIDRFDKKIRYASRKARADVRKRVKGRFVKAGEAYDYDPLCQTRSY